MRLRVLFWLGTMMRFLEIRAEVRIPKSRYLVFVFWLGRKPKKKEKKTAPFFPGMEGIPGHMCIPPCIYGEGGGVLLNPCIFKNKNEKENSQGRGGMHSFPNFRL